MFHKVQNCLDLRCMGVWGHCESCGSQSEVAQQNFEGQSMTSSLAYMQGPNFLNGMSVGVLSFVKLKERGVLAVFIFHFFPGVACESFLLAWAQVWSGETGEPLQQANHHHQPITLVFFFAFLNDKNNMRLHAALRAPLKDFIANAPVHLKADKKEIRIARTRSVTFLDSLRVTCHHIQTKTKGCIWKHQ